MGSMGARSNFHLIPLNGAAKWIAGSRWSRTPTQDRPPRLPLADPTLCLHPNAQFLYVPAVESRRLPRASSYRHSILPAGLSVTSVIGAV